MPVEGEAIVSQVNEPNDLDLSGEIIYAINFGFEEPMIGNVHFKHDEKSSKRILSY